MNKTLKTIISAVLVIAAIACFIVFEIVHIKIVNNNYTLNHLLTGIIYHVVLSLVILWFIFFIVPIPYLSFKETVVKGILWSLPCFLVALVNFPYSTLIKGIVTIDHANMMGLYILYVISIARLEELVFRGILLTYFLDLF